MMVKLGRLASPLMLSGILLTVLSGCQQDKASSLEQGEDAPQPNDAIAALIEPKGQVVTTEVLQEREWVVEDLDGKGVIDFSRATLLFGEDGTLSGRASCNSYRTIYTLTANHLTVEAISTTRKMCPPAVMDQEQRFLESLASVKAIAMTDTGALRLEGDESQTILAR